MKRFKKSLYCLMAAALLLTSCNIAPEEDPATLPAEEETSEESDLPWKIEESDRTSSWDYVNQPVVRSADWKQIVTDSAFQLGEVRVKGSWNTVNGPVDYYEIDFGTYPRLDGSTVAVTMAAEFARQHLGLTDEDAGQFIQFTTTHSAYVNLIQKEESYSGMIYSTSQFLEEDRPVDLIIATWPSHEERLLAESHGVDLTIEPVCYDAFVFITHQDNPVDSITLEQAQKIYSGEITNWKELGGEDAPIVAFQREENSGSQTAMEELVMKGVPMLPPETVKVVWGMGELVDAVAEYQNSQASIGYTYLFYIETLYKNENIKVLEIDGITPTLENLKSNAYPLTTNYYGVIRSEDADGVGGKFLDWMRSEEGQACIAQAGYIPMS